MFFGILASAALGAAALAPTLPPATIAPHGSVDFDMQCMLAGQAAANQVKPEAREQLARLMMYYFGRVDSAVSGDAAKQRLRRVIASLEGYQLAPLMQQCGQFMTQHGAAMEATRRTLMTPPAKK